MAAGTPPFDGGVFGGTGFSLVVLCLARTNPHRLKPARLKSEPSRENVIDKDLRRLAVFCRNAHVIFVELGHKPRGFCARFCWHSRDDPVIVGPMLLDDGDGAISSSARDV
jgi:hypothetical protein